MKLDSARWQRLKTILADALEQHTADTRADFVRRSCGGDSAEWEEARSLLAEAEALLREANEPIEACAAVAGKKLRSDNDPEIGHRFGPYQIVSALGRGGMGAVFLGLRADGEFEKQVAIKILKRGTANEEGLRRFRMERQILANLDHPNITRLLDAGTTLDGLPYFVMDFVDGLPITKYSVKQSLSREKRLRLFLKVCSAVAFAHRHQVIHCDIKPSNVLVSHDAEPKLTDFGIAKLKASDSEQGLEIVLAQEGLTPIYASPEQLAGKPITVATDIYALGELLYELLTKQKPRCLTASAERSHSSSNSLPAGLERIISRAVQSDPVNRYPSVTEFSSAITNYIERDSVKSGLQKISRHWLPWVAGAAAVFLGVAITVRLSRPSSHHGIGGLETAPPIPKEAIRSIAILPFRPLDIGGSDSSLGLGMADAVIGRLCNLKDVSVLPTASIAQFGGDQSDATAAAKALGVDAIVSGTVQRADNRIRVTVQLMQVRGRRVLFADTFDQVVSNVFEIQDLISERVAEFLKSNLRDEVGHQLHKHNTGDTVAYDAYLVGLSHYGMRTKTELEKAIASFQVATTADSHYALAYALMSDCYFLQSYYGFEPSTDALLKARAAADLALESDSSLAEAYLASSNVLEKMGRDSPGIVALLKALRLNPNLAVAHQRYSWWLCATGQLDDAIGEMRKSQALDPLSGTNNTALGVLLLFAHQFEEGRQYCERAAGLVPDNPGMQQNAGYARVLTGRVDEALRAFHRMGLIEPGSKDDGEAKVAMALFRAGRREEAERALAALRPLIESNRIEPYALTLLYTAAGDKDRALMYFERAVKNGINQPGLVRFDPLIDPLREDPRFQAIVARGTMRAAKD